MPDLLGRPIQPGQQGSQQQDPNALLAALQQAQYAQAYNGSQRGLRTAGAGFTNASPTLTNAPLAQHAAAGPGVIGSML